jgi:HAD superfamily hydrolase (TIGR01549 family)
MTPHLPRYRAVLFDLFDTLVRFDRERLPVVQLDGRTVRSTVGKLHEVLRAWAPHVTLEALYGALGDSWREAERLRAIDHREVSAPERFAHLFRRLALDSGDCPPGLVTDLIEAHRRELAKAVEFPAHHATLLEELRRRYRLAVVSNFDYTPTALGILREAGIAAFFETIVVSDAVGWRKPAPAIFREALTRMRLDAREVLFVGDRIDIDVTGALAAGMDVAWVNPSAEPLPPGLAAPTYELRDLADLRAILGGPGPTASDRPPDASNG